MKKLALASIRFYQKYLSLDQGFLRNLVFKGTDYKVCRFSPSCSEYTYQAVNKYGILVGVIKGMYRILRCNPFTKGGYDPLL